MSLDHQRLRYFVTIAEDGSLTAAAARLNIAQPALSHHVALLEHHFSVQLFERHPRGVSLTPAGQLLLSHARRILVQIDHASADMRRIAACGTERVRVGLLSAPAPFLIPHVLRAAATECPRLAIDLVEGDSETLRKLVRTREVALALNLADPARHRPPAAAREALYLAGPPNSIFAQRRTVSLEQALSVPLILPGPSNSLRRLVDRAAARAGRTVTLAMQIDGLPPMKKAVAAGFGYTITSWPVVEQEHAQGMVRINRIVRPELTRFFVLETADTGRLARPLDGAPQQAASLLLRLLGKLSKEVGWPHTILRAPV